MLLTLRELIAELTDLQVTGNPDTAVRSVVTDSRRVRPGDLFIALPGQRVDGGDFIADALARGATAVVCRAVPASATTAGAVFVTVPDPAAVVGPLASAYFGHPSRRLRLVGVTGTDGKTTTTLLTTAVLRAAGFITAHSTTVEFHNGRKARPNGAGFTTPQAPDLQGLLGEAAFAGATHAVLEVSSHALETGRVAGCEFDTAVFTNLAPEHLDYHHTLDAYRAAKLRLFTALNAPRHKPHAPLGVVNADDPAAADFIAAAPAWRTYGLHAPAQVTARSLRLHGGGARFVLVAPEGEVPVESRLLGRFNVANWLAAAAAGLACGATLEHVAAAAAATAAPPGRLQPIPATGVPFDVYVDFAHTPQGLGAAIDTLAELHPEGGVVAVFGHAGGRDARLRRALVEAARARGARCVLTMDDPYDEDPAAILAAMREAALGLGAIEGDQFHCVLDRRDAFALAFRLAGPGDAVLLAGRGHERAIPLRGELLPFHDATVAEELLAAP